MSTPVAQWVGNAGAVSQILSLTVSAVATGGILSVTINTKTVSYTCVFGDSTTSAATALAALLAALTFPEFQEATWTSANNVVTATAAEAGTPIYSAAGGWGVSVSGTGGAAISLAETQPNVSPSDIANPNNWLRTVGSVAPVNQLPQAGDAWVISDSSVPMLWNLNQLPAPSTFTRWQDFTGTIGLPENNPSGYVEYRPTYLSFTTSSSSSASSSPSTSLITAIIGQGNVGSGPTRERYNFGAHQVAWTVRAAGSPQDDYSVRILGTNALTTLNIVSVSVGIGMLPGESAQLATAVVDGGGSLDLGPNVTVAGAAGLTLYGAAANLFCSVPNLSMQQGATVTVMSTGVTYPLITCITGSSIVWNSDSGITTISVLNGSSVDFSQDVRPVSVQTVTIDGDTCQWNDPNNRTVPIQNAVVIGQRVLAGPFIFGSGRSFKIS